MGTCKSIRLVRSVSAHPLLILVLLTTNAVTPYRSPCTCGRIADIEQAKHGNFPWTAAIVGKYGYDVLCWGSIINSHYILSSASCTSKLDSTDIEVILNAQEGHVNPRRSVAKIKNHPGFTVGNFSYDNDISLVKIRQGVDLNWEGVSPICLSPEPPRFYEDDSAKRNFSKWCKDCDFVQNPEERSMIMSKFTRYEITELPFPVRVQRFEKINIFTLKNDTCTRFYPNRIKCQFLCGEVKNINEAGKQNSELRTSCQDDPGSALIHLRKMKMGCDSDYERTKEKVKVRFVQIGISSEQKDCHQHNDKPVLLFTRIERYVSWIKENTFDADYCDNSPM